MPSKAAPKGEKKVKKVAIEDTDKKPRGAPKAYPPKSIIQRSAKKNFPGKNFQAAAYKLIQDLVVEYARNIFTQSQQVLNNRKGRTLTKKDIVVLSTIAQTAGTTPEKKELTDAVRAYEQEIKSSPAYQKKKDDRARKREEKRAAKIAEKAAKEQETVQ